LVRVVSEVCLDQAQESLFAAPAALRIKANATSATMTRCAACRVRYPSRAALACITLAISGREARRRDAEGTAVGRRQTEAEEQNRHVHPDHRFRGKELTAARLP
jgi:hypothetical protein